MNNSRSFASVVALIGLTAAMIIFAAPNTANAQIKPAMVRNVDEPARVPYLVSAQATCPFVNECTLSGSTVPAGKRLRVTRLAGVLINQTASIFFALHLNDSVHPLVMFPAAPINGAFWGYVVSFNQEIDFYFEAGQTPILEIGTGGIISLDSRNRLTIVGYLVDVLP
jgi:hypothetical protein